MGPACADYGLCADSHSCVAPSSLRLASDNTSLETSTLIDPPVTTQVCHPNDRTVKLFPLDDSIAEPADRLIANSGNLGREWPRRSGGRQSKLDLYVRRDRFRVNAMRGNRGCGARRGLRRLNPASCRSARACARNPKRLYRRLP